jgi:lipoic acid synthetase
MSCTPSNKSNKQRDFDKLSRIPIKIEPTENNDRMRLPRWLYTPLPKASEGSTISFIKKELRSKGLSSVCEEASCPNLPECFSKKTATFMIMGDKCTRRCSFCDVAHGKPDALNQDEPKKLAESILKMGLKYVVVTSVDRDDLRDGGANHFAECIRETRLLNPGIKIEVLVPDFRGKNRMQIALDVFTANPPDVFNHNVETIPRLYPQARPGSDYQWSLNLLKNVKERLPHVPTKSGLMLGLGETNEEIEQVLVDLRAHNVDMLTVGQYLQPSKFHLAIQRYATPAEFNYLGEVAKKLGFKNVASGPQVRSSYHADMQVEGDMIIAV